MIDFGNRTRFVEERMNATEPSTTIVRHEREPMSGWIMAFMVMVVLVGLGFMSLMDLSSQQAKTERELFQLQQEFNKAKADSELNVAATNRDDVYSQLNSDTEVADGTMISSKPGDTTADDLAAPFPVGPNNAIEKIEGTASVSPSAAQPVQPAAPAAPAPSTKVNPPVPGADAATK